MPDNPRRAEWIITGPQERTVRGGVVVTTEHHYIGPDIAPADRDYGGRIGTAPAHVYHPLAADQIMH